MQGSAAYDFTQGFIALGNHMSSGMRVARKRERERERESSLVCVREDIECEREREKEKERERRYVWLHVCVFA